MNNKKRLWDIARHAAWQVEFLTTGNELLLYANAIYSAMMWGWGKDIEKIEKEVSKREKMRNINV